eukprot:600922-Pelagomonas_calceolata.AAC.2
MVLATLHVMDCLLSLCFGEVTGSRALYLQPGNPFLASCLQRQAHNMHACLCVADLKSALPPMLNSPFKQTCAL